MAGLEIESVAQIAKTLAAYRYLNELTFTDKCRATFNQKVIAARFCEIVGQATNRHFLLDREIASRDESQTINVQDLH